MSVYDRVDHDARSATRGIENQSAKQEEIIEKPLTMFPNLRTSSSQLFPGLFQADRRSFGRDRDVRFRKTL